MKPTVAILLTPPMRARMLSPEAEAALSCVADVRAAESTELAADLLPDLLRGASAALTGWGTPPLAAALLAGLPELRLVAHSAGSIRRLVPAEAIATGRLRVTHAAGHIAEAVAEFVIAQVLGVLRRAHLHDSGMKDGSDWFALREQHRGRLLGALTVGLVGAGHVGRRVCALLRPFGCRILVADPKIPTERAREMGAEIVPVDVLLATADIVSLHAPVLPETTHMIGAAQFALLRDGAIFINTARSLLVDQAAQLEALRQGRFTALLDVFDTEPLPLDSPLRALANVWLSPHAAGHTVDTYHRQGQAAVDDLARFIRGDVLLNEVTSDMLLSMA